MLRVAQPQAVQVPNGPAESPSSSFATPSKKPHTHTHASANVSLVEDDPVLQKQQKQQRGNSIKKRRSWYVDRSNCVRRLSYVGRPGSRRWKRHDNLRNMQVNLGVNMGGEVERQDEEVGYAYSYNNDAHQSAFIDAAAAEDDVRQKVVEDASMIECERPMPTPTPFRGADKKDASMACYLRIPRNARDAIKMLPIPADLVVSLETHIRESFFEYMDESQEYELDTSFDRFLLHCLAQYYGLESESHAPREQHENASSKPNIQPSKDESPASIPHASASISSSSSQSGATRRTILKNSNGIMECPPLPLAHFIL